MITMEANYKKYAGGVWPVMLTPFTRENKVDENALEKLTEWYIESGVKGLFAACQSSEIFNLTFEERMKIVEITLKASKGRVPVIASANTSESLEDQAKELNAVWIENLHRLMSMLDSDMRLGIYECPYPYKRVLNEEEMQAMIDTGRFFFIKDTCCDIDVIQRKLQQIQGSSIQLFNANTTTLLESLEAGADGYCGVMANFHPELYVWLCDHYKESDAQIVSHVLTMNSLIERQLYPVNAKWHLKEIEGLPMEICARVKNCEELTETFKKEVIAMDRLSNNIFEKYCTVGK